MDATPDKTHDLVEELSAETFEEWVEKARRENPQMTDEQLRAGWEEARTLMGL